MQRFMTMLAMQLDEFIVDSHALEIGEFLAKHGRGFLLRCALDRAPDLIGVDWDPASRLRKTEFNPRIQPDVLPMNFGSQFSVYRLRPRPGVTVHMTVGRLVESDVCIPDSSISKRHAKVRLLEGDGFAIMDLNSRNGTVVDQTQLPVRVWQQLEDSAAVQLGDMKLTFMLGQQFVEFLQKAFGVAA